MKKKFSISITGIAIGIALFLLNLFDAVVTSYILLNNLGVEWSPIVNWLIDCCGLGVFMAAKILLGALIIVCFGLAWDKHKWCRICGTAVLIIYATLAAYHILNLILLSLS